MGTLLLCFQQLRNGLPSLNMAVPALKMIHVKEVQKVQIIERVHDMVLDDRGMKVRKIAETIGKRTCRIGYEKALCKMGAALAHSRSKTHSQ